MLDVSAFIAHKCIKRSETHKRNEPMTTITLNNKEYDADVVANMMDDEIREELHAKGFDNEQEFVDAYVVAHAAKYDGDEFVI